MEPATKISFLIVNHKNGNFIPQCLSSISRTCEGLNFEIIIVNNDNSNLSFPSAKIINLKKNLGYGHACNQGARIATGEIFCFLNPDTEILDDINKIINLFDNSSPCHPKLVSGSQEMPKQVRHDTNKIGIIGPKLVTEKNEVQPWCAGKEINLKNIIKNKLGISSSKEIWNSSKTIECDWVSGACLFIHKYLFQKIGGFDEKFFMYFEDMDLCRGARKLGYKVIYFPAWNVKHLGGKSFKSKFKQKKLYYSSLFYYFKKNLIKKGSIS